MWATSIGYWVSYIQWWLTTESYILVTFVELFWPKTTLNSRIADCHKLCHWTHPFSAFVSLPECWRMPWNVVALSFFKSHWCLNEQTTTNSIQHAHIDNNLINLFSSFGLTDWGPLFRPLHQCWTNQAHGFTYWAPVRMEKFFGPNTHAAAAAAAHQHQSKWQKYTRIRSINFPHKCMAIRPSPI